MDNVTDQLPLPYGGDYFAAFNRGYFPVHGYLAIVIATCGIVLNVINISVLSQRRMINPISAILTALAVSDGLTMIAYVPFALHQYILRATLSAREWRTYAWMTFICFNVHFTVVVHTMSVWLTVTLAVFQYIAVRRPLQVPH